jgi:DNA-binding response OmpR family regulator
MTQSNLYEVAPRYPHEVRPRLLVVDDSVEGRALTKLVLRRAGFAVDEASNVAEAWVQLKQAPEVIVLDVKLPDGNGLDFARRLRANVDTMAIPIVHTSAVHTTFRERAQGLDAGADAYLIDPIDPALLVATVRALLRMRSAERDAKRSAENEAHLRAVSIALNQVVTTSDVAEIVLEEGIRALNALGGRLIFHRNATQPPMERTQGILTASPHQQTEMLGQAVRTRSAVHVTNLSSADGPTVGVAVPFIAGDNGDATDDVLGALYVEIQTDLSATQLAYLATLAEQAGNTLIRASLYEAALAELQDGEQQLRRLVEYAPDAIVVIDATDMRCLQANPAAAELLGIPTGALVGSLMVSWSPERQPSGARSAAEVMIAIQQASAGLAPVYEWSFHNALTGAEVECEVRLLRLPDPHRVLIRGSVLRIDGHKAAQAAERRATESAGQALREHNIAVELQRSFLPRQLETVTGVSVHSRYEAASEYLAVGGDWYDSIALSPTRIAFVVGDVVGHGIEAVTAMGQLRSAVAAFATDNNGPADAINRLEHFAKRVVGAEFSTIFYVDLELETSTLRYACAGHPPPLLIARNGETQFLQQGRSAPLGVSLTRPRTHATVTFEPGSALLLFTDGLVERRSSPIDIGLAALAAVASTLPNTSPAEFCGQILTAMTANQKLSDDVAMLLVHRNDADS